MDDEKILYQFEIPYPWKKLIRGLFLLTIFIMACILPIFAIQDYYSGRLFTTASVIGFPLIILIAFGLYLAMRYILIHGDKIKTPIRVTVTPEKVYWEKARGKLKFYLYAVKDLHILVNDKKAMIDVNYREMIGTSQGWRLQFRRADEFSSNEDFHRFVKETFPRLKEVVKRRITELNPDVTIIEEDKRRKYT